MSEELPYPIEQPDRSLGDLVGDLTSEFSHLVQDHIELAKREIKADVRQAGRAGGALAGAAVVGLLALVALTMAAGWGLAEVMAPGWAFLIVGAAWGLIAAGLGLAGKKQIDRMDPGPQQTMNELEEDKQWIETMP